MYIYVYRSVQKSVTIASRISDVSILTIATKANHLYINMYDILIWKSSAIYWPVAEGGGGGGGGGGGHQSSDGFPRKQPVMRGLMFFYVVSLNKLLKKQWIAYDSRHINSYVTAL